MRYRKKPVVIEAEQLTQERIDAYVLDKAPPLPAGCILDAADWNIHTRVIHFSRVVVDTLEGRMRAEPGDWIITGVKGEHYPCKPDIFALTYEPESAAPASKDGPPGEGSTAAYWRTRAHAAEAAPMPSAAPRTGLDTGPFSPFGVTCPRCKAPPGTECDASVHSSKPGGDPDAARPWPPTETEEEWVSRHKGHVTEEYTPDPSCERRSLFCHDCDEEKSWPKRSAKSVPRGVESNHADREEVRRGPAATGGLDGNVLHVGRVGRGAGSLDQSARLEGRGDDGSRNAQRSAGAATDLRGDHPEGVSPLGDSRRAGLRANEAVAAADSSGETPVWTAAEYQALQRSRDDALAELLALKGVAVGSRQELLTRAITATHTLYVALGGNATYEGGAARRALETLESLRNSTGFTPAAPAPEKKT